jgi:Ribonucleotide reductase, barrel domain/Ribonucleotide reductase, all-alpha domain
MWTTRKRGLQVFDVVQVRSGARVVTDSARDARLTAFGKATLSDRYLLPGESYQDMFARVASAYADDDAHAQRLYDYISNLWFMPATPVLSNGGTSRGLPISCFLNEATDSLEGIVGLWNENVWLAARGGGIGSYWGNLRSIGEKVGLNGKTSGVVPFIRVMDSLTLAISQGSLRRGSAAVYLPVSHPEIEEFIEIRRQTGGDPNRKATNLHHGLLISDAFMRAVENDEEWALTSPKDGAVLRKISARSLWIRILTARIETGEPYLIFVDHVNKAMPEHHKLAGLEVKTSNLCSEITLPTGVDHHGKQRTAVCCLSSLNVETYLEWAEHPTFIEDVMRFLDNVLQGFIDNAGTDFAKATYAAMRERSVGLGIMGFHSFLQANGIPIEAVMAKVWNKKMFKHIRGQFRLRRTLLQQARDRAHGVDLDHLWRRLARHRAVSGQRLQSQDAVGLLRGAQPVSREAARAEGPQRRGHLDVDHDRPGFRPEPRLPRRPREGRLQDRLRDRPALAGRARRRPRALHLPEPVAQHLPAGRRAQTRPASDPHDGVEARREEPLLLPLALHPARRKRRRRGAGRPCPFNARTRRSLGPNRHAAGTGSAERLRRVP